MGVQMMGFGSGFGVVSLLLMLLFWGGLVVLAIWLVRALFPHVKAPRANAADRETSAREILDRRYAGGEISREQYDLIKKTMAEEVQ